MFKSRSHASALSGTRTIEDDETRHMSVNEQRQPTLDDSVVDSPKYSKYMPFITRSPIPLGGVGMNSSQLFQSAGLDSFSLDDDFQSQALTSSAMHEKIKNEPKRENNYLHVATAAHSHLDLTLFVKQIQTTEITVELHSGGITIREEEMSTADFFYQIQVKQNMRSWSILRSYAHFSHLHAEILTNVSNQMNTLPTLPLNHRSNTTTLGMCEKLTSYLCNVVSISSILDNRKSGTVLCAFLDNEFSSLSLSYELVMNREELTFLKNKHAEQSEKISGLLEEVEELHKYKLAKAGKGAKGKGKKRGRLHSNASGLVRSRDKDPAFGIGLSDSQSEDEQETQSDNDNFGFYGNDSDTSNDEYVVSDNENSEEYMADGQGHLNYINKRVITDDLIPYVGASLRTSEVDFSPVVFVQERLAECLQVLGPTEASIKKRNKIQGLVKDVLKKALAAQAYAIGGFSLRSYLPEDSISLSVFVSHANQNLWFAKVSEILCSMAAQSPEVAARYPYIPACTGMGNGTEKTQAGERCNDDIHTIGNSTNSNNRLRSVSVQEVLFFPSEGARKIQCVVNGVRVDITANRLDELCMVAFLEEVDRHVGREHLFKKSLTLIKAWLFYEGKEFKRAPDHFKDVQDHLICALVIHMFNVDHGRRIFTPLHALAIFFQTFATLNWSAQIVTPFGIIPVYEWNIEIFQSMREQSQFVHARDLIGRYSERYRRSRRRGDGVINQDSKVDANSVSETEYMNLNLPAISDHGVGYDEDFQFSGDFQWNESINVMDPLDESNNIGTKISTLSSDTVSRFKRLLLAGAGKLKAMLQNLQVEQDRFMTILQNMTSHISSMDTTALREKTKRKCIRNVDSVFVQTLKRLSRPREDEDVVSDQYESKTTDGDGHRNGYGVDWETALASAASAEAEAANIISTRPESSVDFNNFSSIHNASHVSADVMRKVASFPANMRRNAYDSVLSLESLNDDYSAFEILVPNDSNSNNIEFANVDKYAIDLDSVKSSLQYCSLLLDSEVTAPALLSLSREILKEKGALPVGEIGKMLQEATSNSQIPGILKEKFGGLKKFLELNPEVFLISTDHPYNPKVYLKEELSEMEISAIAAGNPPPARLQSTVVSSSSRKRKGGKKKSKPTSANLNANSSEANMNININSNSSNPLLGIRGSHSMVDLSLMNQYADRSQTLRTRQIMAQQMALQQVTQQNQNQYATSSQSQRGYMGHHAQIPMQNQRILMQQALHQQNHQQQYPPPHHYH